MEANVVILLTHKSIPTFKIEPFLSVLDSVSKVSKIQICSYKKKKKPKNSLHFPIYGNFLKM